MTEKRHVDHATLVGGLILITVGVLFLLDRFDVTDVGHLLRWYWPLIIVCVGLPKLFRRHTFWSGLWLVTAGAWMQIAQLRLFGLTFRTSWPLLLIALGAGIIAKSLFEAISLPDKEGRHEA